MNPSDSGGMTERISRASEIKHGSKRTRKYREPGASFCDEAPGRGVADMLASSGSRRRFRMFSVIFFVNSSYGTLYPPAARST